MPILTKVSGALREAGVEFCTDAKSLFSASLDHARYSFLPDIVAYANGPDDVSQVLKIANRLGTPVSVRGSGTGCAGGCVPTTGGIVLDLHRINFIEIDPLSRIAHVGAGAITADVDKAAWAHGLFYAPDPSSHKYSSIGGNIACNAGGLRALKYGCTRENLAALSVCLPNGETVKCGLPLRKFSAGPNLRDLFVGSEGTLGVVTEAWLRLLPLPKARRAAISFFNGDDEGFKGVEKILLSEITPCVLEFMDSETLECVRRRNPQLQIAPGKSALLAEFDGTESEAEEGARRFVEILSDYGARMAKSEKEAEEFWQVRRKSSQAMYELGDSKVNQDIVLPFREVCGFFKFFKGLGRELNLATPVFGHAGDGNYHIHFMYYVAEKNARERALAGMEKAIFKTIELGGAVSGEHGIGFLKSKYMPAQHSDCELSLMKEIKKLFDPKNILNPGKIYSVSDISGLQPLRGVKLPWD